MASKRKASAMANAANEEPVDPSDELKFICLGGGNEVGRSCHIIQYKGKTVMVCDPSFLRIMATVANLPSSSMPASTLPTMDWPPCPSLTTST